MQNLKLLRQTKGVSQQKLADAIMVSQQSVNKYENHNVEPDIDTLVKIADYFDVSVDYLIGRTDVKERASEISSSDLTNSEREIIKNIRRLTNKQKDCIVTIIESYNCIY